MLREFVCMGIAEYFVSINFEICEDNDIIIRLAIET
jgi:hypothetical protein